MQNGNEKNIIYVDIVIILVYYIRKGGLNVQDNNMLEILNRLKMERVLQLTQKLLRFALLKNGMGLCLYQLGIQLCHF